MAHAGCLGSAVPDFHFLICLLHPLTASLLLVGQYGSGHPDPDFGKPTLIQPSAMKPLHQPQECPLPGIPR